MTIAHITAVCLATVLFACGPAEKGPAEQMASVSEVVRYQSDDDSSGGSASEHASTLEKSSLIQTAGGSSVSDDSDAGEPGKSGDKGTKPSVESMPSEGTGGTNSIGGSRSSTGGESATGGLIVSTGGSAPQGTTSAPVAGSTSTGDTAEISVTGGAENTAATTESTIPKSASHLVVKLDDLPVKSDIAIPFKDTGDALALGKEMVRYVVTNDGLVSDRLGKLVIEQPYSSGTMEDCSRVLVTVDGTACTEAFTPINLNMIKADLSSASCNQKRIEPKGQLSVSVYCHVANPVSRSTAWRTSPQSGDVFGLKIKSLTSASGTMGHVKWHIAPYMVLRKSKPIVTVTNTSGNLGNTEESGLFAFIVNVVGTGNIALKQVMFPIATGTGIRSLTSFKVYRGAMDITKESVSDLSFDGKTLRMTFADGKEEVVSSLGQRYRIATIPSLMVANDSTATTAVKIREESSTLRVVTSAFETTSGHLTQLSQEDSSFVWSDLSMPTSPLATNREWTNGVFISGLTESVFNSYGY